MVGTEYVQATDEIDVIAVAEQGTLTITATFLTSATAPYSEEESLRVGSYQIIDGFGDVVVEGEGNDFGDIIDGKAVMTLSLEDIDHGDYTLLISSFVGSKKADQDLEISGYWECDFTI